MLSLSLFWSWTLIVIVVCRHDVTGKFIIRCTMASMGPKNTSGPCRCYRHLAASSGPAEAWDARGWSGVARWGGFGLHEAWFQDALKEARASDTVMQVLVGLMCVASVRTSTRSSRRWDPPSLLFWIFVQSAVELVDFFKGFFLE
jgi:hypothetical protein